MAVKKIRGKYMIDRQHGIFHRYHTDINRLLILLRTACDFFPPLQKKHKMPLLATSSLYKRQWK